ncbi:winged helix-turn-helix domain-containing protein [Micromonospora sp. NPDC050980]|uniref:GntR family transcriptional regulator n=1 Tax=Micromonospora sp. NPDC050980 TaxID=3155161 RepID=UPI00340E3123
MTSEPEDLADLDRDDPRPPSQQIANVIRAAIRTRKFQPGERLPSQHDLAERFDVARETVKSALRILRDERLIVTRQGSGAFVRAQTERPVGLRPHIEAAFDRPHVAIDFAGFSGETLHGVLTEPLDKIRAGRLTPESVTIRILLPDVDKPMALPCPAETRADDPAVRARAKRITHRHTEGILAAVRELAHFRLVGEAKAEVRVHRSAPAFKLYILNGEEVFFGFYPVVEHTVTIDGKDVGIFDPMGKDAILFHRAISEDETSDAAQYVEQARSWFDSMWSTIAREYQQ